ncbi:hypothetical protein G5G89_001507, partial [Escherichia coli]|nr:hypothetical protein [Escherichia coli]
MTHKTKATGGGRQWENTKHKPEHHSDLLAGGQCDQCAGLLVGYSCTLTSPCRDVFQVYGPFFVRLYSLRNFSRAKAHGANLSDSCSCAIFLRRPFRVGDGVFVNALSFMVSTCITMGRSSSHHGAGDGYSCSLAFLRWRRLISPSSAETINCPVLS